MLKTVAIGDMAKAFKLLYIGNILPLQVVESLNLSLAGKKYEISLVQNLNNILFENLEIVSVSKIGHKESKENSNFEIFTNKKFNLIQTSNIPILEDLISNIHFFFTILFWSIRNIKHKKTVLILNSPVGICISAVLLKYLLNIKPVSLTIDTPFIKENRFNGILGYYHKTAFKWGHRILKLFSGIIVLNRGVINTLELNIPFHITNVGYTEINYTHILNKHYSNKSLNSSSIRKIVYAGTFIENKGIVNLLKAFTLIDKEKFELDLYGYGPLENMVREYSNKYNNIKLFGRIDYEELLLRLSEADLLINPTTTNDPAMDFSFPSKLTEYLLSCRPVLTTRFSSLPIQYLSFVFLIEKETPEGICEAIISVFNESEEVINNMISKGVNYIKNFQNWNKISDNIINFLNAL